MRRGGRDGVSAVLNGGFPGESVPSGVFTMFLYAIAPGTPLSRKWDSRRRIERSVACKSYTVRTGKKSKTDVTVDSFFASALCNTFCSR